MKNILPKQVQNKIIFIQRRPDWFCHPKIYTQKNLKEVFQAEGAYNKWKHRSKQRNEEWENGKYVVNIKQKCIFYFI